MPLPKPKPGKICGTCSGRGIVMVRRRAIIDGKSRTEYIPQTCKTCKGKGRVK